MISCKNLSICWADPNLAKIVDLSSGAKMPQKVRSPGPGIFYISPKRKNPLFTGIFLYP